MTRSFVRFWRDEVGGPLVEAAIVLPVFLLLAVGSVDFFYAFYQWTAAAKAVEVGARLAPVSHPVASGLNTIPVNATGLLEDPMPDFGVTCQPSCCTCTPGPCP